MNIWAAATINSKSDLAAISVDKENLYQNKQELLVKMYSVNFYNSHDGELELYECKQKA